MNGKCLTKVALLIALVQAGPLSSSLYSSPAAANNLTIGGYTQTAVVRVNAHEFEHTYTAVITNTGASVTAVGATLKSSDPNIKIIDGTLTFGDITGNSSKVSQDTFTIRQDERYPLDSSVLSWSIFFFPASSATALSADPGMESALTSINGFQDSVVFSGLTEPTAVQFASDGRVFVAEKSGIIKVYNNLSATTPTVFADLRTQVHNFGNRGLLGMALDPNFPTNPYVYVLYSYDAVIGGTAPKWGTPGGTSDPCPDLNGAGCIASARLSRLQASGSVMVGAEQVLVEDWFQQYPGQSIGGLSFGPDGNLYASGGDGASYAVVDTGQIGNPNNDPPNEGGALRSQDLRSPADPVTLDGTIIRVNPTTGVPVRGAVSMTVSAPTTDANGVKSYSATSVFQGPVPTTVRVLEPTSPAPGWPRRFLYVLPVEAELGTTYGDGLEELRLLNVHNRYNVTLIAPSFHIAPWYGDHATDPDRRLESFVIQDLIPFGDSFAAAGTIPQRWAIGFSKSGFGALSLILRNPNVFSAAAAWDAPAQMNTFEFADVQDTFGTLANLGQYVIPTLVTNNSAPFKTLNRIWISGDNAMYTADMVQLDTQMTQAGIVHTFVGGVTRTHSWGSGWLDGAVTSLATNAVATDVRDVNYQRIVAYGLRNPRRLVFRPGTSELWVGDIGWTNYEEINRVVNAGDGVTENFGWPCSEGTGSTSYTSAGLHLCDPVVTPPATIQLPFFSYAHNQAVVNGEACGTTGGVISGLAFYNGGNYPTLFQGALFFADASRNCIWSMVTGVSGLPDPATRATFVAGASSPYDLRTGPNGDLFYVDNTGGNIRRITYDPTTLAVYITAPVPNSTLTNTVTITTWASSNVTSVQFQLDGNNIGSPVTIAPYTFSWNTRSTTNGPHTLTAVARDATGHTATSAPIAVSVSNTTTPVTYIQSSSNTNNTAATTISQAFSAGNTAGNLIVAAISSEMNVTVTCSDSRGNTYTIARTLYDSSDNQSLTICYAANIAAGANTVTATFGSSVAYRRLLIHEYAGAIAVNSLDVTAGNIATGTTATDAITSTAATTTGPGDLIFGAVMDDQGVNSIAAGTGFVQRQSVNNKDLASEDMVQGFAGSIAATHTFSAAHRYLSIMAAFKAGLIADTTPPVISGVAVTSIGGTSATIQWTTNENADSQVEYGLTSSYGSATTLNPALVTAHLVGLGGLTSSTLYHYRVKSKDAAGNLATSGDFTFTTGDITPPVITGLAVSSIAATNATIQWTTDEAADTQVEYGLTASYGSTTTRNPTLVTAHTVSVSGLTAATTYHYRVRSSDASGNLAISSDSTFTTLNSNAPVITGVTATSISATSAMVQWTTSTASDSQVEYGLTTAYGSTTTLDPALVTAHTVALNGLTENTTYHYRVKSNDASANLSISSDFTFSTLDITPPVISGVAVASIGGTGATIQWTTNELSDSQVEYGLTTAYGSTTTINPALVTSHNVALSGLTDSTTYHYRVKSKDSSGNLGVSGDFTFTTLDVTPPIVSGVTVASVGGTSATVQWTTNEASDSQVEYGLTVSYGATTTLDPTLVTSHRVNVTGLTGSTTYHYRVKSKDAAGNLATSGDFTFTTLDITPPVISGVTVSSITLTSATVTWTTNEASDSQADYGTSTAYGSSTPLNASLVTSHTALLTGLSANTLYHYRVDSKDAAGNLASSGDFTFTTPILDVTPPTVSITVPAANSTLTNTVTVTASASDNVAVASVQFVLDGNNLGSAVTTSPYSISWNTRTSANGAHTLTAVARDAAGNSAASAAVPVNISNVPVVFVQGTGTSNNASATSIAQAFTSPNTAGNLIVAAVSSENNPTVACSDSQGNTYSVATTQYDNTKNQFLAICYAANVRAGANTVTATLSVAAGYRRLLVHEYAGIATVNPLDVVALNNANGNTLTDFTTTTAATTTAAGDLIFSALMDDEGTNTITAGTGFTLRQSLNNMDMASEDQVQPAAGSIAGTYTLTIGHRFLAQMAAFKTGTAVDVTPPVISGIAVNSIGATGVTIQWITNEPSDSQVEYGLTTSYGFTTTLDPTLQTAHSVALSGLTDSTTYHYRVKSKDAAGNLAASSDATFTTNDITPPVISGITVSSVGGTSTTIQWATNELADSQVEYGLTASYGSTTTLDPTLRTAHSVALTGLADSTTYHYRVKSRDAAGNLATSTDQTFTTSDVTPPVISGLTATAVAATSATIQWTTNEASDSQVDYGPTTSYGSTTTLDPTLRTAHTVALSGLTDGTTYHYRVKSKDAAGNLAASSDATFTTNDITPPVISGIAVSSVAGTSTTIQWTTNELADSQVEYGLTASYGSTTTVDPTLRTAHSVALTGLADSTTYHYRVKSRDAAGNLATSTDQTFTTSDVTPPVISGLTATAVAATSATIQWTTNEASDSQVDYGPTTSYGSTTTLDPTLRTAHTVALSGLTDGTTYHYRVKSKDAASNLAASSDATFTTNDITPPVISGIAVTNIIGTGATIQWSTNEASTSQVEYGLTNGYGSTTALDATMRTAHSVALTGLTDSTTYHYRVRSTDAAGNLAISADATFTTSDITPPVISGVAVAAVSGTSATIQWTTNEAADSQVEYGLTIAYGSTTVLDPTLGTSHTVTAGGLAGSTTYHYRVRSKDAAGNLAMSADSTFTTLDITPPVISGVAVAAIGGTGATIQWTTNEAADGQVEYGVTTSYGSATTLDPTLTTSHIVALSGLAGSTTYHYRVRSKDAAGNLAMGADSTFTTLDITPPIISGVTASVVAATSATIQWNTNEASDSQVEFGLTSSYGSSTTLNTALVTAHSAVLSGLSPAATYHYRVDSRDAAGNLAISGDFTLTTAALDTTPPTVSITSPGNGATVAGTVTLTVTASDNVGVAGVQYYLDNVALGTEQTTNPYSMPWNTTTAPDGSHTLKAVARDAAGNTGQSAVITVQVSNGVPINFQQSAGSTSDSTASTITQALPLATTAGNLIVAAVSWGSSSGLTCSDNQGNGYTTVTVQFDGTKNQSLGICYAANIKGGAVTVTATFSGTPPYRRIIVHEYTGVAATSPVDITKINNANGTTTANGVTTTAATTTASGDLIFAAVMDDAAVTTIRAGTNFTLRGSVSGSDLGTEDMIQATAGSIAGTWTFTSADRYLAQMVAFKHK
jgi:glucose/arabinose dehydrogenase